MPAIRSRKRSAAKTKPDRGLKPARAVLLPGGKPELLIPIEGELQLVTHIDFNCDGQQFGAYLLRVGKTKWRLVFGFDVAGIHPNLPYQQIKPIYNRICAGFKSLPDGEALTIHMKSFRDNTDRLEELQQTIDGCNSELLRYILTTEQKRTQELNQAGLRKPKSLRIYVTHTFDPDADIDDDPVASIAKGFYKVLAKFSGADKIAKTREFSEFLESGVNAFHRWEQILNHKMGLGVTPLSAQGLWGDLWARLNSTPAPPVPQIIRFDGKNISERVDRPLHPLSILINDRHSLPKTANSCIKVKGKVVKVMTMVENPAQWENRQDALTYLWNKLGEDSVYDTEIVTQIVKQPVGKSSKKLKDLTDEQIYKANEAEATGEINVAAQINAEEAIEAQAILHRGDFALKIASTWLVHRDDIEVLNRDCAALSSRFLYPANLCEEEVLCWKTWLQTFPVNWDYMMTHIADRRGEVFTNVAPAVLPLTRISSRDRRGFELVSENGGVPLYIDLVSPGTQKNLIWIAKKRSGKSVAITKLVDGVLAHNLPVTIVDCPTSREAASFDDYTRIQGGSYFDLKSECSNIFELPHVSHLSPEDRDDRRKDYEDYLLEVLQALVLGSRSTQIDPQFLALVRTLLVLVLTKFFAAREIKSRYQAAKQAGFGSPAWAKYPVLEDYIRFCTPARIGVSDAKQIEALRYIATQLTGWSQSSIGGAFCRPSTFKLDAQLLVMGLRGIENPEDMAIMGMVVYGTSLRRAYGFKKSLFFLDEAAVLLKYAAFSLQIGRMCAIGAKAGLSIIIAAQEADSIYQSAGGKQIFSNNDILLVGKIEAAIADDCADTLKIPRELLDPNITTAYEPNRAWGYSNWLAVIEGTYTPVRIYASPGGLAVTVNNVHEVQRRRELIQQALDRELHPIHGLHEYARELIQTA